MQTKVPSAIDIENEIKALEALLVKIPSHNAFGDSNVDSVEAEIRVLREDLTIEDLEDARDEALDNEDEDSWLFSEYVFSSASVAANWMAGEAETETLSEGWQNLVGLKVNLLPPPDVALAALNAPPAPKQKKNPRATKKSKSNKKSK